MKASSGSLALPLVLLPLLALLVAVPLALAEAPAHARTASRRCRTTRRCRTSSCRPGSFDPDDGPERRHLPARSTSRCASTTPSTSPRTSARPARRATSAAYRARSAQDSLTAEGASRATRATRPTTTTSNTVKPGDDATGQCALLPPRATRPATATRVARAAMPRANLLFDHKTHVDRNIGCAQCHGAVDQLELATRDQLPRMRGCFNCHQMPDSASRGDGEERVRHLPPPRRRRRAHAHQDDVRERDAHAAPLAAQRRAHAGLHRAAQARRRGRLAVLRQLPQGGLLHRLPRRPRPPAEHPPERLPEHAPHRGAHGAAEVPELPPGAELLPRLPHARRRGRVEPAERQGQRPLPPAEEHLERPADEARAPRRSRPSAT